MPIFLVIIKSFSSRWAHPRYRITYKFLYVRVGLAFFFPLAHGIINLTEM